MGWGDGIREPGVWKIVLRHSLHTYLAFLIRGEGKELSWIEWLELFINFFAFVGQSGDKGGKFKVFQDGRHRLI